MFKYLVGGLLLAESTLGACPNACSGHGQCGEHDMCVCHVDWLGGDCSDRACPSHFAWVTTNANGDLNADGDRDDVTVYDMDHSFTDMGIPYIVSQNEPFGTWEQWPAYGNVASVDEGHYYMECANRGICDRSSGQCQCFPGYTGHSCQRSVCPNDCSGHGVCKTVSQLGAQLSSALAYDLWDKDMSRSCVCDSGFTGPDCGERKCPLGDDPLTTGQTYETQWVDIWTELDTTNWVDRTFSGHISLKYTDYNGKVWQTDDIEIAPYTTSMTVDTANSVNTKVAAALNGLPNNVLSGVTVTPMYMEKVIPGNLQVNSGTTIASATNGATSFVVEDGSNSKLVRCPGVTGDEDYLMYITSSGGTYPISPVQITDGTTAISLTNTGTIDDTVCYMVDYPWSLRLEIKFPNTPGNLVELSVDTSKVVVAGQTEAQRGTGNELVGSSVSGTRKLAVTSTNGAVAKYTQSSGVTTSCDNNGQGCTIASKVLTVATGEGVKYPYGSRIQITCAGTLRGIYTVASVTGDALTLTEDIADCDPLTNTIDVVLKSHHVEVNADLTSMLSAGDLLKVSSWKSVTSKIVSVQYETSSGTGHIFLTDDFGASETDSDPTVPNTIDQQGDGTTEKEECSSRGLCDSETGVCRCFGGYTGWACSVQNSLAVPL